MARQLSVKAFTAASAAYVKAAVEKANTNHNKYLTKAEAAKLPKDLQDTYRKVQAASSNGTVSASTFIADYARRVATAAEAADLNGNGIISSTELRQLPEDLQDNAINWAGIKTPAQPKTITSVALPLSQTNIDTVRAAMVDFVENELTQRKPTVDGFEYASSDWGDLVFEFGGDDEHAGLKAEALAMAKKWTPNSDWEANTTSDGGVYFTGAFKIITMFVELDKGKAPSFQTEID